jgi:catechol 2,3-dioxygenase-like lactoylglutathione lyase family enzyme
VRYHAPDGRSSAREIRDPGQAHLAIAVDDADAMHARLVSAGIRFVTPPNEITAGVNLGGKACYFFGPDDIVHELLEPPLARRRAYHAGSDG